MGSALIVSNSFSAKLNDREDEHVDAASKRLTDLDAAYNKERFGRKGIVHFCSSM